MSARIKGILGADDWQLQINSNDPNIIEFEYPISIEAMLDYIRPRVILELGTHAEPVPNENYDVTPFAAEHFPQLFAGCSMDELRLGAYLCEVTTDSENGSG